MLRAAPGARRRFFFAVGNMRAGYKYKLNIINLCKPDSLYNHGMQPLVHSAVLQATQGLGWHRAGEQVAYYQNAIRRSRSKRCVASCLARARAGAAWAGMIASRTLCGG